MKNLFTPKQKQKQKKKQKQKTNKKKSSFIRRQFQI